MQYLPATFRSEGCLVLDGLPHFAVSRLVCVLPQLYTQPLSPPVMRMAANRPPDPVVFCLERLGKLHHQCGAAMALSVETKP